MRAWGFWSLAAALGLSLAACSGKDHSTEVAGRIASQGGRASIAVGASASSATAAKPTRFAALPDRGELLRYTAQAPIHDGAYTWHRTELSEQHALDAVASGMLRVMAPDGRPLGFRYDHSIRHDSGDWTWVGYLPGQEGVQAILTFGKDAVYGSIGQPDARPLRLTMRGGASWLVETDPTQLAGLASHAANPVSPDYRIVTPEALQRLREKRAASGGVKASALAPNAVSATTASTPTIDLLIGYTQGFVTAKGSTSAVVTRLNSMVDTANVGLSNSQVNGQIRLVHTMQVSYTDTNDNGDALGQLTGYDSDTQKETTPNAAFNALRTARETYGADLVSLVRPFREPEQDSCGIAWLVGGGKQGDTVSANNGWDYFGYSVVSDGTDYNETDKKTYYCEEHTLAHELGHNMGSQHDRDNSKGDDNVLDDPDDYGAFAYSFGYKPAAFYTIMAYGDKGQTSYLAFSNPRITICGGVACGVANAEDNAKSLGLVMPKVAGFRLAQVAGQTTLPAARRIDVNSNGHSDLFFFNHSTGRLVTWFMNGTTRTAYSTSVVPGAYHVAGTGYFNTGDRRGDLLLAGSGGKLYRAISNGSKFTLSTLPYTVGSTSQVIDTADVNGNGQTDILLRNTSTGKVVVWFMNNGVRTSYSAWSILPRFGFVTSADFNGDGRADLLFENTSQLLYVAISNGAGSFNLTSVNLTHATTSIVRGATDINGDGKADILFHSKSQNKLFVWYMNGASRIGYTSVSAPSGAELVALGDFDGNGKGDVGWANASNGRLWLTLKAGSLSTTLLPYTAQVSASSPMDIDL